jgi:hypothetical protein
VKDAKIEILGRKAARADCSSSFESGDATPRVYFVSNDRRTQLGPIS